MDIKETDIHEALRLFARAQCALDTAQKELTTAHGWVLKAEESVAAAQGVTLALGAELKTLLDPSYSRSLKETIGGFEPETRGARVRQGLSPT